MIIINPHPQKIIKNLYNNSPSYIEEKIHADRLYEVEGYFGSEEVLSKLDAIPSNW